MLVTMVIILNNSFIFINNQGVVEEHQLAKVQSVSIPCKPVKEITHVSRYLQLFTEYGNMVRENQLALTLDMIVNSCNILNCSKFVMNGVQPNQNNERILEFQQENLQKSTQTSQNSSLCYCLSGLEQNNNSLNGISQKSFDFNPAFDMKDQNCLCKETLFLKHTHNEDCGHPKITHGDHIDYIVEGHLHHVHGNHCDDHGPILIVS